MGRSVGQCVSHPVIGSQAARNVTAEATHVLPSGGSLWLCEKSAPPSRTVPPGSSLSIWHAPAGLWILQVRLGTL